MTYRTQTSRLMRRLGFVAEAPNASHILTADQATYWRHKPSNARIVLGHKERVTEAKVVSCVIAVAITQTLRDLREAVVKPIDAARAANEVATVIRSGEEKL